jgi:hypothetical protein
LWNCYQSGRARDLRERWNFDADGRIHFQKDKNKCITAITSVETGDIAFNKRVYASSTINDNQHIGQRITDGSNSYWASAPGLLDVNVVINLGDLMTAKIVTIYWKYPAEAFELAIYTANGLWMTAVDVKGNGQMKTKVELVP